MDLNNGLPNLSRRGMLAALGAGAALAAFPFAGVTRAATPGRRRSLRVAHLTDIHVQPERGAGEGLAACLAHVQSLSEKPDLILTGGDLVMDSFDAGEARTALQWALLTGGFKSGCSIPVEHCLGNHDIWGWNKKKSKTSGEEALWGKKWALDALGLEKPYRSFERGVWKFIVLDSVFPRGDGYIGRLDDEQFAWLEGELANLRPDQHALVLSHIPILNACCFSHDSQSGETKVPAGSMMTDVHRIRQAFKKSGRVRAAISGHIHVDEDLALDGVRWLCNGAVSGAWWKGKEDRCDEGYAVLDLFEDGTVERKYVTYGWKARA